jgi:hypothetical protein
MPKKLTQEQAKAKDRSGKPILIGEYKGSRTKTEFKCPYCDTVFLAEPLHIWQDNTKSCGCSTYKWRTCNTYTGTKDISGNYFGRLIANAKCRNLEFTITKEYIQQLLEKQNYKCALTGLVICGSRNTVKKCSTYQEQTASLDRIDPTKGYTTENVQWVHKNINNIKHNFTEEQLLQYCKLIIKHNKNKKCKSKT